MSRNTGITILLLTSTRMVRGDYDRAGRRLALTVSERPAEDETPLDMIVQSALRLGGRIKGRVWVVSTDLWTQTMALPAAATAGIGEAELNQALAFECEALSGIAATDSALGSAPAGQEQGRRRFWVAQMENHELDAVRDAVASRGGQLAGFAHAGGVVGPLTEAAHAAGETWGRVEIWPEVRIAVAQRSGDGRPAVDVQPHQPDGTAYLTELAQMPAPRELLVMAGGVDAEAAAASGDVAIVDPDAEPTLQCWTDAWARQLQHDAAAVPAIRPAERPMSAQQRTSLSVTVAVIVALLLAGHWAWSAQAQAEVDAELEQLEQQRATWQEAEQELEDAEQRMHELREEVEREQQELERIEQAVRANQARPAALLAALAEHRPRDLVVQRMRFEGAAVLIEGVCADPDEAGHFAADLSQALQPVGWRVQAPSTQAQLQGRGGALWQFTLRLREGSPQRADDRRSVRQEGRR